MTQEVLESRIVRVSEISHSTRKDMFQLLERYFDGYEWNNFINDLEEKDGVLLLEKEAIVRGFTTFKFLNAIVDSKKVRGVFSGDTIVDHDCWGQTILSTTWSKYMLDQSLLGEKPFFWFLISSGYKTYRFLPTFFNEFYPRCDRATPEFQQRVLDIFATNKFGDMYDRESGTIRFTRSNERLKPGVADFNDAKLSNPHIRYFIEKNPNHAQGVELACLAEISLTNYKSSALKRFGVNYATKQE